MKKTSLLWIIAFIITLAAAYYQRKTGPSYPLKTEVVLDGQIYVFNLKRSHGGKEDCTIVLEIPSEDIRGVLVYRRFPTNDEWKEIELTRDKENLFGQLPIQPPAGKLEYYIVLQKGDDSVSFPVEHTVVIRFKGAVPKSILFTHVLLMFLTMLLSTMAGLMALTKHPRQKTYGLIAFFLLLAGGMILGPVVQKYAFGELWTGVPLGWDLTDNKTLIAFIFWMIAVLGNRKKDRPGLTILAAVVLLVIFSIPHSMFGSELNYETGEMIQGIIFLPVYN